MDDEDGNDTKFHVIFCRNVMISFDEPTRKSIVRRLCRQTMPGGYLFIGLSESIGQCDTDYRYVQSGVYRLDTMN